jgi:adenine phosphoribosyltransferase
MPMNYYSPLHSLEEQIDQIGTQIKAEHSMLEDAVQAFRDADIYTVNREDGLVENYQYFIYPFKGMTLVDTALYQLLGKFLARMVPKEAEVIVSIEADGIGIATFVAAELGLPLVIAKHFHYNVPCVEFTQQAGYHKRQMYLPKCIEGKKVALIDCMVSTGGTIKAMVKAMEGMHDVTVLGTYCVNDKNNYRTKEKTLAGYAYKYLISATIDEQGDVQANSSWDLRKTFWESLDEKFYKITEQCSTFSSVSKRGYQVGSIIVDANTFEILSWGYRRGNLHAEQDAIAMLKTNCPDWKKRQLTIYSTMEPCCYRNDKDHTSCAEIIADIEQIKWVIIGSRDVADKKIDGEGMNLLLSNGKHIRLIETDEILRPEEFVKESATSGALAMQTI